MMPLTSGGLHTGGLDSGKLRTGRINDTRKADKAKKKRSAAEKKAADKKRAADKRAADKEDLAKRREIRKEDDFDIFHKKEKKEDGMQDGNHPPTVQEPKTIEGVPGQVVGRIDLQKFEYLNNAWNLATSVGAVRIAVADFFTFGETPGPVASAADKLETLALALAGEGEPDAVAMALAATLRAFVESWGDADADWRDLLAWLNAARNLSSVFAESKNAK